MVRRACDGAGLVDAFRAGVANLEAHVDEINSLNVYPVPDGDTGSNMYATVKAALDEAEAVTDVTVERVAAAISFGALILALFTIHPRPLGTPEEEQMRQTGMKEGFRYVKGDQVTPLRSGKIQLQS